MNSIDTDTEMHWCGFTIAEHGEIGTTGVRKYSCTQLKAREVTKAWIDFGREPWWRQQWLTWTRRTPASSGRVS